MTTRIPVATVFVTVAVATSLASVSSLDIGPQEVTRPPLSAHERDIVNKRDRAWEIGGFRAAAAVTGSYRVTRSANDLNADSVAFLVQHSPLIIVGRVLSNRTWLNARGDLITTDYQVLVDRALKGPSQAGTITMSVAGGKIVFEDGSWAEVHIRDMLLPVNGEQYILFLRPTQYEPGPEQRRAAAGPIYMPSFEALSLYRINERGLITPKTFSGHRLFRKYAGKPEGGLIDDIAAAVAAQKAAVGR